MAIVDPEFEDALRTLTESIEEASASSSRHMAPGDEGVGGTEGDEDDDLYEDGEEEEIETPEERERDVIEKIKLMLEAGEHGKNILSDDEAQNLLRYQQGPAGQVVGKTWRCTPQLNLQKSALELAMATRNDQEMGWNARGRNGPDSDLVAGMVQAMMRETWTRSAMKEKRLEISFSSGVLGGAAIKTIWEDANEEHSGRNAISVSDMRACVADPYSSNNDDLQASGYWIELPMLSSGQIYRSWPKDIRGRDTSDLLDDLMAEPSEAEAVGRELHRDLFKGEFEHRYPDDQAKDRFLIAQAWYPDHTMKTVPIFDTQTTAQIDPATGQLAAATVENVKVGTKRVQKYPKGRLSVVVLPRAGDAVVLVDQPNTYGHIPVVYHQEGIDPTRLLGISMYRDTNSLADMISDTLGCIVDFTKMQAFPKAIIDITRLPEGLEISDSPGEMLESNGPTEGAFTYVAPGNMAGEVFRFLDMARRLMDDINGQYEVSKGQKPPSITAAQAIEAIQSVAMLRPKLKNAMMAFSLERVAKQMLQNIVNFGGYDKRWLSLSGEEGKRLYDRIETYRQQQIQASHGSSSPLDPNDPMSGLPPYISDVVAYSPDGSPNPSAFHIGWIAEHMKAAADGIDIEIEVNTPQTQSKVGRAEQALAVAPMLDKMQGPALEYLLKSLDIPGWESMVAAKQAEGSAQGMLADIKPKFDALMAWFQQKQIPLPWEQGQQQQQGGQPGGPQQPPPMQGGMAA